MRSRWMLALALAALLFAGAVFPAAAQGPAVVLCSAVTVSGVCATTLTLNSAPTVAVALSGSFVASVAIQGTIDGSNWYTLTGYATGSTSGSTGASNVAVLRYNTTGFVTLRANPTCTNCAGGLTVTAIPSSTALPVVTP
jgi:hypothetical protein